MQPDFGPSRSARIAHALGGSLVCFLWLRSCTHHVCFIWQSNCSWPVGQSWSHSRVVFFPLSLVRWLHMATFATVLLFVFLRLQSAEWKMNVLLRRLHSKRFCCVLVIFQQQRISPSKDHQSWRELEQAIAAHVAVSSENRDHEQRADPKGPGQTWTGWWMFEGWLVDVSRLVGPNFTNLNP